MGARIKPNPQVPMLSSKEALIIELLLKARRDEAYGLELVINSGGQLKRGTVYVTLNRMEDKGYIQSRHEEPQINQSGLPRRLYRATGYGERVYAAWQLARKALRLRSLPIGGEA